MKLQYVFIIVSLAVAIFFASCKKEPSCEECRNGNKPPIAVAGPDQAITLPADSISLDGSASNDPDGTITSYRWKKISGPASFTFYNEFAATTIVKSLGAGTYLFELTVTDNKGSSAKDTLQLSITVPNFSLYVAGVDYNGSYLVKKYWKNGIPVTLDMGENAFVTGITISGGDVYVAAVENNGTHYIAKYFKNGNPVALTDGSHDAYTTGIVVVANDVYVSGSENDGTQYSYYDDAGDLVTSNYSRAKYWKNGNPVVLTGSSHNSYTTDIGVVGNNVYVTGSENNGTNSPAQYWKNGNPVSLPDGSNGSTIALAISGDDVYVLGYGGGSIKYWKNGTPVVLFSNGYQYIGVSDIAVSGNDVYVLGSEYNGTNDVAKYWKNGHPVPLTGNIPHAFAIVVDGSDAYVAGYDHVGYARAAKYWKNGSSIELATGGRYSYAIAIAVTR